jgi:hypothetical protein
MTLLVLGLQQIIWKKRHRNDFVESRRGYLWTVWPSAHTRPQVHFRR